jgi:hypothetical protein
MGIYFCLLFVALLAVVCVFPCPLFDIPSFTSSSYQCLSHALCYISSYIYICVAARLDSRLVCSKPEVQQNAMFLPCAGVREMYIYAEHKEAFAVDIGFLV